MVPLRVRGQEDWNELVATLTDLAPSLLEAHVMAELHHRFVPCEGVKIHRVQERPVEIEDGGFRHSNSSIE
jgi:hypothetical protein